MVIYFSKNGSTRKYAKALSAIKNEPLFKIKQKKAIGGSVTSAIKSVMKKKKKYWKFLIFQTILFCT